MNTRLLMVKTADHERKVQARLVANVEVPDRHTEQMEASLIVDLLAVASLIAANHAKGRLINRWPMGLLRDWTDVARHLAESEGFLDHELLAARMAARRCLSEVAGDGQ